MHSDSRIRGIDEFDHEFLEQMFVVAADSEPLGAIWMRYFDAADLGYGFVDEQAPEITIGVREGFRGQRVGRVLVQAAQEAAPARLSLSVEDGNRAIQLYESVGFVPVGRVGNSTTMLWTPAASNSLGS